MFGHLGSGWIWKEVLIYIRAESLRFHKRFHRIFTNLFVNQLLLTCIREDGGIFTTVFQRIFEGYFHLYTVSWTRFYNLIFENPFEIILHYIGSGNANFIRESKKILSFVTNWSFLTCIGEDEAEFLTSQIKKAKLICDIPSLYCYTKFSKNETPARNFLKDAFII